MVMDTGSALETHSSWFCPDLTLRCHHSWALCLLCIRMMIQEEIRCNGFSSFHQDFSINVKNVVYNPLLRKGVIALSSIFNIFNNNLTEYNVTTAIKVVQRTQMTSEFPLFSLNLAIRKPLRPNLPHRFNLRVCLSGDQQEVTLHFKLPLAHVLPKHNENI